MSFRKEKVPQNSFIEMPNEDGNKEMSPKKKPGYNNVSLASAPDCTGILWSKHVKRFEGRDDSVWPLFPSTTYSHLMQPAFLEIV